MGKKLGYLLKTSYLQVLLTTVLILLTIIGTLLFWNSTKKAEEILTEKVKLRESILANAGAMAINEFFETRETRVLMLASMSEFKTLDKIKGSEIVKKFIYDVQSQPISAIGVLDKQGKIVWSENPQNVKVEVGLDLSDRAYFQWAKNQKEEGNVYISDPIVSRTGSSKGSWIVTVVTPLFNNSQFNGVVYLSMPIDALVNKLVTPLTISPKSTQMIITKDGTVIGSTIAESTGINLFKNDDSQENNIKGLSELANKINANKDGSMVAQLTYPGGNLMKIVLGYAAITANNQSWTLLVSVPYQEVTDQLNPFSTIQNEGLFILFFGLIALIVFDLLIMRIAERQGYRNGYSKCLIENKKTK